MLNEEMQPNQPAEGASPDQSTGDPNQDMYDIFVSQGILLAEEAAKDLVDKASVEVLGGTLFQIVNRIQTDGEQNGVEFGLDVLLHGSNEILAHLLEMVGVDINEEQVKAVVGIAVGMWVQDSVESGRMTPEELQQMTQQGPEPQGEAPPAGPMGPGGQNGLLG